MRECGDDVIKVLGNHLNKEKVVNMKRKVEDSQGFLRGEYSYINQIFCLNVNFYHYKNVEIYFIVCTRYKKYEKT